MDQKRDSLSWKVQGNETLVMKVTPELKRNTRFRNRERIKDSKVWRQKKKKKNLNDVSSSK